jgi:hypothetical protein
MRTVRAAGALRPAISLCLCQAERRSHSALSATITDQQRGAVGGAKVVAKNVATDVAVQTSTNTVGGTVH